jgi:class 3 adenylate cyclase/tetratricopeptide (TPR) repeat protein
MAACPKCGEDNSERARFCQSCGSPLSAAAPGPVRTRKTVTVLFSDITGSTALGEQLDPESVRSIMARYFDGMRRVLERHGATVEKFIGDAVMAVFGIPQVHEDDALRAVKAASEMRDTLEDLNTELEARWGIRIRNRTGVNTGEVVAGDTGSASTLATGDAVNVAARLEQAAGPGEILLGETTYRLVRHAVRVATGIPLSLKGKTEPVTAYRLLDVLPEGRVRERRLVAPLVGRDAELGQLLAAFEEVEAERSCRLVTVLGAPGLGKSRLVSEAVAALGDRATVLHGRCLPYGDGITFWPVIEVMKQAAGVTDADPPAEVLRRLGDMAAELGMDPADAPRLATLMGLAPAGGTIEESFRAVRVLLQAMSRRRPLVVVVEDIHWAEPSLLDLLHHVVELARDAPILVLCPARPELLEARPGWGADLPNSTIVPLRPLSEEESRRMVPAALGVSGLEAVAEQVTRAAGGNPLFIEEMLGMMIDDGVLVHRDGNWLVAQDSSTLAVPATIAALIASRLDRLSEEERAVAEWASVVGKEFQRDALVALSDGGSLDPSLDELVQKEYIVPTASPGAYRFRHILIRDEAYSAIPKEHRAKLHERFGNWLEVQAGQRLPEYEEIVGYHLEQGHRYLSELGLDDKRTGALARRASDRLDHAGRRAAARGDLSAAVKLLSRSASLLDEDDPALASVVLELGDASVQAGEFAEAEDAFRRGQEVADISGNRLLAAHLTAKRRFARLFTDPTARLEDLRRELGGTVRLFEEAAYREGLADVWLQLGILSVWGGQATAALDLLERAVAAARTAGNERVESQASVFALAAAFFGSTPLAETMELVDAVAKDPSTPVHVQAFARTERSACLAMEGRFDEARDEWSRARALADELGPAVAPMTAMASFGQVVFELTGELDEAEAVLRPAYDRFLEAGETGHLSTVACELGHIVLDQHREEEALTLSDLSERNAAADDVWSQVGWRTLRARVLGRRGEHELAEQLAREAVEHALSTDYLHHIGQTLLRAAEVMRAAGKLEEAADYTRGAAEVFERKGNIVSAERARNHLAGPAGKESL